MESQPQNPEFRINPENFHPGKSTTSADPSLTLDANNSSSWITRPQTLLPGTSV